MVYAPKPPSFSSISTSPTSGGYSKVGGGSGVAAPPSSGGYSKVGGGSGVASAPEGYNTPSKGKSRSGGGSRPTPKEQKAQASLIDRGTPEPQKRASVISRTERQPTRVSSPSKREQEARASLVDRGDTRVERVDRGSPADFQRRTGLLTPQQEIREQPELPKTQRIISKSQRRLQQLGVPESARSAFGEVGSSFFGSFEAGLQFGERVGRTRPIEGAILTGLAGPAAVLEGAATVIGTSVQRGVEPIGGQRVGQIAGAGAEFAVLVGSLPRSIPKGLGLAYTKLAPKVASNLPRGATTAQEFLRGTQSAGRLSSDLTSIYSGRAFQAGRIASEAGRAVATPVGGLALGTAAGIAGPTVQRNVSRLGETPNLTSRIDQLTSEGVTSAIYQRTQERVRKEAGPIAELGFELGGGRGGETRAATGGSARRIFREEAVKVLEARGLPSGDAKSLASALVRTEFDPSQQGLLGSFAGISTQTEIFGNVIARRPIEGRISSLVSTKILERGTTGLTRGAIAGGFGAVKPLALAGALEGVESELAIQSAFRRDFDPVRTAFAGAAGAFAAPALGFLPVAGGVEQALTRGARGGRVQKASEGFGKTIDVFEDFGDVMAGSFNVQGARIGTRRVRTRVPGVTATGVSIPSIQDSPLFSTEAVIGQTPVPQAQPSLDSSIVTFNQTPTQPVPNLQDNIFAQPNFNVDPIFNQPTEQPIQQPTEQPTQSISIAVSVPVATPFGRAGLPFLFPPGGAPRGGRRGGGRGRTKFINELSLAFQGFQRGISGNAFGTTRRSSRRKSRRR